MPGSPFLPTRAMGFCFQGLENLSSGILFIYRDNKHHQLEILAYLQVVVVQKK